MITKFLYTRLLRHSIVQKMTQSSQVSQILDRITQESSEVIQTRKTPTRAKRSQKSARPQRVQLSIPQTPREPTEPTFEKQWEIVDSCLNSVFTSSGAGQFEPAFHAIEKMCKQPENIEPIHKNLQSRLSSFATEILSRMLPPVNLESIAITAKHCERAGILLSSLFADFERVHPPSVDKMLISIIKDSITQNPNAISGICMAVNISLNEQRSFLMSREKELATVSPPLVQVSEFIEKVGIGEHVLTSCAKESAEFYRNLTVDAESPERFLLNVKAVLEKEQTIISPLNSSIQAAMMRETRTHSYVRKLRSDIDEYVTTLVDNRNLTCLKLMATLVFTAKEKELEDGMTKAWIKDTDTRVNAALELKSLKMIDRLFELHASMLECKSFFDLEHQKQILRGFRTSVNTKANRVAFMLARFVHQKIMASSNDFTRFIDTVTLLFRELESMDLFLEHHRQFLALRLLGYVKDPPKVETVFIRKLALICGDEGVKNMKGMMSDILTSFQITREFDAQSKMPMRFTVIESQVWPNYPNVNLVIPSEVLDAAARFTAFYKTRNPSRKLTWNHALDEVSFRLNGCLFTGSVMYYLLMDSIVEGKEFEQSGLSEKEVDALVSVLVKSGVVVIEDGQKKIREGKWPSRIKLPVPLAISPRQMTDQTIEEVEWSRKIKIEAAIVLVMKRLKVAAEDKIHSECLRIINFNMNRRDFDGALASCLEKAYLVKNDEGDFLFTPG